MASDKPSMKPIDDMTVKELKEELGKRKAVKTGKKKQLVER